MDKDATAQLPDFPLRTGDVLLSSTAAALRPAKRSDLPFLCLLYRSFRLGELEQAPWSLQEKQAFLDQQFSLQHRYYTTVFSPADFLIIEKDGMRIGRLYIDLSAAKWLVIDIGLLPEWRGRGLGFAILRDIQDAMTATAGLGIALHVDNTNMRAQKLYQSLGFEVTEATETHTGMEWLPQKALRRMMDSTANIN
ncbi:GNAT family N-acetyltransferase [Phyllobacterium myrsinacearum]|uniref:Ribosomal protein S18 acetylase RimI-like enzyme n=1 Tax=Phyllobacterium myrsinacearum TaxID=28101 RepID=A0A839EP36_9HYPH|nr:N-acetyltransferase [Phyllobacterium myrsinacearum]MBA8879176.1 ribosomal protein S18 acetylase RimI-like enzyme [Phyllobacterium myrsinacearum]